MNLEKLSIETSQFKMKRGEKNFKKSVGQSLKVKNTMGTPVEEEKEKEQKKYLK